VKKLKVVDITPKGNVVQVTGKNGSGKTSVKIGIVMEDGEVAADNQEDARV